MNVDVLINKYYLEMRSLKADEAKQNKENSKKGKSNIKAHRIIMLIILIIASVGFALGLFLFKNAIISGISGAVMLIIALIGAILSARDKNIQEWIDYYEEYNKKRIKKLNDLLEEYKIQPDENNIERLIEAAKKNQDKYDYFKIVKKILGLFCSMLAMLFSNIAAFSELKISDDGVISLIYVGLLCIVFFSSVYYLAITELDPLLRKRYYFHDTFVYDLMQLGVFRSYYTENQIILSKSDKTDSTSK